MAKSNPKSGSACPLWPNNWPIAALRSLRHTRRFLHAFHSSKKYILPSKGALERPLDSDFFCMVAGQEVFRGPNRKKEDKAKEIGHRTMSKKIVKNQPKKKMENSKISPSQVPQTKPHNFQVSWRIWLTRPKLFQTKHTRLTHLLLRFWCSCWLSQTQHPNLYIDIPHSITTHICSTTISCTQV